MSTEATLPCEHRTKSSDEPRGTDDIVRWRCVACGQVIYSDESLARLRTKMAVREAEVRSLEAALTSITRIVHEELGECTHN